MKRGHLGLRGGMRGGRLPNQLITSPETLKFIEETHIKNCVLRRSRRKKLYFCKKALAEKRKNDRAAQRKKLLQSPGK